ncbi:MAG: cytochrome c [Betaproteobacteria bacterium]
MRRFILAGSLAMAAMTMGGTLAHAQAKPEDVIKYRQAAYRVMGWNFAPMAATVKGEKPYDKEAFARNAANVEFMSRQLIEGFAPGSDKGETKAKPEIWSKMDDFKGKMTKLNEETAKLAAISKSGTFDEIKKQFGATAGACKACHDEYKNK